MASAPPAAADLTGRVAVVTGAAQGIGRATARAIAAAGASVVVADVDGAEGAATAEEVGGRFVATDVTLPHALEMLFGVAEHELGGVDVLVNAARGAAAPHYPDAPFDAWGAALDLNLRAPMRATQLALASMRGRGNGAIVNVASVAGVGLAADAAPEHAAAQAGLIRFTAALSDLAGEGIRVSAVCPAPTLAPEVVAGLILELAVHPDSAGRVVVWPADSDPYALG